MGNFTKLMLSVLMAHFISCFAFRDRLINRREMFAPRDGLDGLGRGYKRHVFASRDGLIYKRHGSVFRDGLISKTRSYTNMGHKTCKKGVYTRIDGSCDGWARTSASDCIKKCQNNEVPSGCDARICSYAIHDANSDFPPGWCQLATDDCISEPSGTKITLYKVNSHFSGFTNMGQKTCTKGIYSRKHGRCDGWSKTSAELCKTKCLFNDVPSGCDSRKCSYAIYDDNSDFPPGWCQLATDDCIPKPSGRKTTLYKGYIYMGHTTCIKGIYTRKRGSCDGWAKTSAEDCIKKCQNNEVPSGCEPQKCSYAIHDDNSDHPPGWCQLATDDCIPKPSGTKTTLYKV